MLAALWFLDLTVWRLEDLRLLQCCIEEPSTTPSMITPSHVLPFDRSSEREIFRRAVQEEVFRIHDARDPSTSMDLHWITCCTQMVSVDKCFNSVTKNDIFDCNGVHFRDAFKRAALRGEKGEEVEVLPTDTSNSAFQGSHGLESTALPPHSWSTMRVWWWNVSHSWSTTSIWTRNNASAVECFALVWSALRVSTHNDESGKLVAPG